MYRSRADQSVAQTANNPDLMETKSESIGPNVAGAGSEYEMTGALQ